jgi:predicted RNA-binding protein YlxR (DUF448 family)
VSRSTPPRRIPERSCVACRTARAKRDLLRVVRAPDGTISLDPTGRRAGRGAYLCRDAACWELAARKRSLDHAFKAPVPEAVFAALADDPAVAAAITEPVQRAVPGAPNTASDQGGGAHGSK